MRLLFWALSLAALFSAVTALAAGTQSVETGYWKLTLAEGAPTGLFADATGESQYGPNLLSTKASDWSPLGFEALDPTTLTLPLIEGTTVVWDHAAALERGLLASCEVAGVPATLEPEATLGQDFETQVRARLRVSVTTPTWSATDSAATLRLKREGPEGQLIAEQRFANIKDNSWLALETADMVPAGRYYLELAEAKGTIGWWSPASDAYLAGTAYANGQPVGGDRQFRVEATVGKSARLTLSFEGNRLNMTAEKGRKGEKPSLYWVLPWQKAGYETADPKVAPFHHCYTDIDMYYPVHQFKRRPYSGMSAANWVRFVGNGGADLLFSGTAGIGLTFFDDYMVFGFNSTDLTVEVLPQNQPVPAHFPTFTGSDTKRAALATEFLYSHGLNFGVGTGAPWKHWLSLTLDWQRNNQTDANAIQISDQYVVGGQVQTSGYVNTWGPTIGWPFPFKDEDGDGANDYDTRHFSTNSNFILGAWRHYCFSQDRAYLDKLMPSLRLAMDYQLRQLGGESGVLLANGEGHTGKHGGIPSNYWDILPFGWKDAFSNSLFYGSLRAMAELEEAYGQPEGRSPDEYRQLARLAHKAYDATFWNEEAGRYVGCVDVEGVAHDYGYTFVNMQALAFGLGDETKARRIYDWMETGITSSGKADTYSRWVFAPRASTFHNPPVSAAQEPLPSWWFWGWLGTPFEAQCQDGGAILYTSYDDVMARLRYLGLDNAWERFATILDRYAEPDHLSGGAPLFRGEDPQGGPGGHAGSVGVEGEFPESGIVPCIWLYGFVGVQPTVEGLKIRPRIPRALEWAGVRGIAYAGGTLNLEATPELLSYSFTRGNTKREEVVQIPRGQACLLKPDGNYELVSAFDNWP